eukprot:scaffold466_cov247-Chaetoceros_neogracile.AAC.14
MVHMKIIEQEDQLIKLQDSQATKVPFPPGCPVLVLDTTGIRYSGKVAAVYISFDHTGSCHNYYRIVCSDGLGCDETSEVVDGDKVRYAINCPITISSKAGKVDENKSIEGVIKGFEIQDEDRESTSNTPFFLYTVAVSAISSDENEQVFRQNGIAPDFIRYRVVNEVFESSNSSSSEVPHDKGSVISLDGGKSSNAFTSPRKTKNEIQESTPRRQPIQSPKAHYRGTFSPPPSQMLSTPQTPHSRISLAKSRSPELIAENEKEGEVGEKNYRKCHRLSTPPTHFQGEFSMDARVPDFSFLTNFPPKRAGNSKDGFRCCVMCGVSRNCNQGKSTKTKSMKSSDEYSQNSVVIPTQNKGLCTMCDVEIWVIKNCGTQIKWCKGCKNFKDWSTFGEKGGASKCVCCRDRQKLKYAASKKRKFDKMLVTENALERPTIS